MNTLGFSRIRFMHTAYFKQQAIIWKSSSLVISYLSGIHRFKIAEITAQKNVEKSAEKTTEKTAERTAEKTAEKNEEKTAEKTAEKLRTKLRTKPQTNRGQTAGNTAYKSRRAHDNIVIIQLIYINSISISIIYNRRYHRKQNGLAKTFCFVWHSNSRALNNWRRW